MLSAIISFSIKNKLIIGLLALALTVYGIYEAKRLPIDAVPDITNNQVQIITIAPSLGAVDVERLITFPLEQANLNIPHLKELRSFSRLGLSVITLVFDDETDTYWARQQIMERIQQVQDELPKGLGTPFLAPVTTGLGEIYQYVVRVQKGYEKVYTAMELRTIQDWIIRKQLLGVNGVAEVSSFGGLVKQYEIAVEPEKLMAYNLSITDVFTALEKNNQNTGGSYIEKESSALFIRSEGLVGSLNDIENIVIKNVENGVPLFIRNVANVRYGNAVRYGALTYNGEFQVTGAVVMMLKGANSNRVVENVKKRIQEIEKTLPEGVVIEPFIDRTKMVNKAIDTVAKNLMEGALIVVFILVLFLGNIRAGVLVASVIPLSMLFAIICMNVFGVSGNLMSLGALDFGLIVDGAVIIVEAVLHRLSQNKTFNAVSQLSQQQIDTEVNKAATKLMNSAVFGQLIILIVYLPIFSLQGIEGKMFKPMAQTVAFALIGAFILSLTYVPMMCSWILYRNLPHSKTLSYRLTHYLERVYQRLIIKVLRYQKWVLLTVGVLLVMAFFMFTRLGGEFIPSLPEGDFAVETRVLPGSNINTSIEAVSKASEILLTNFPEITKIVGKTGSSEVPTDPMPIEATDIIIVLKDRAEWVSAYTYQDLEAKMQKALNALPGVQFSFQYPVAMRFNELISGAKQDVVCKIFGENLDTLSYYAEKLGKICHSVRGSSGVYVEPVSGLPQIVIKHNQAVIAQYGLNVKDINTLINTAFAGQSAGKIYEGEKRFDLVVRLASEKRKSIEDVKNLLIPTSMGTQIPLKTVADIQIADGPNQIQREFSHRRIIVGFNVRGRDVESLVQELQSIVTQQIKLPPGYYISYGGAFKNLQEAKERLLVAVPIALILIFVLLYFAFGSVKDGLLIYTAIPLSAIGGVLALAVRGMPFSVSAGVGFIALFGVAVLNGIVLVAEFNHLKSESYKNNFRLVIHGAKTRLRPVLMTASVAALGFLPMAISTGEGAEVQRPLATVVIGGLIIASFLTLFVLPILYISFNRIPWMNPKLTIALLLITFGGSPKIMAQKPITLQAAIDTALANNLSLNNEYLKAEYQKALILSGNNLPNTLLAGDYGQINSIFFDKRLGILQNFSFPTVYSQQKHLLTEEWKSSVIKANLQELELKKIVTITFHQLIAMQQKRKLLLHLDSIYSEFLHKATQRLNKGESSLMEKNMAENQLGQIYIQISALEKDIQLWLMQFRLLLNTSTIYLPTENSIEKKDFATADTHLLEVHPTLLYWKQQQKLAQVYTKLEKAKRLPDVFLGYNIMSMRGEGADLNTYDARFRFQSVQAGVGIPIFYTAYKSRIKAAEMNEKIADNEYQMNLQKVENRYLSLLNEYKKLQEIVNYYESVALKNAESITQYARLQYTKGEINYLEWTLLINQTTAIYSDYIETVKNINSLTAELNYFNNE